MNPLSVFIFIYSFTSKWAVIIQTSGSKMPKIYSDVKWRNVSFKSKINQVDRKVRSVVSIYNNTNLFLSLTAVKRIKHVKSVCYSDIIVLS